MGIPGRAQMLDEMQGQATVDFEALLTRMKSAVFTSRTRVKDFFVDFDQLRSGCVSQAKFRTALQAANVTALSEAELQQLTARYAHPDLADRVCYSALLEDLAVFNTPGMERAPLSQSLSFVPTPLNQSLPPPDPDCDALRQHGLFMQFAAVMMPYNARALDAFCDASPPPLLHPEPRYGPRGS